MVYWKKTQTEVCAMKFVLVFAIAFGVPLILLLLTRQEKKRGCGRGCATCGNREICHRKNLEKSENAQKIRNNFDTKPPCSPDFSDVK